ncbi:hypothetical protein ACSSS7_006958 [Eimeria intestinalis]
MMENRSSMKKVLWLLLVLLPLGLLASTEAHATFGEQQAGVGRQQLFTGGILARLGPQIGVLSRGFSAGGPPPPLLVYVSHAELRDFADTWPSMFPNFQPASVDPLGDVRASWRRQATSDFLAALKKTPSLLLKKAQITPTPLRTNALSAGLPFATAVTRISKFLADGPLNPMEATISNRRRFFKRLFKRDASSSKKGPLVVLLCVYPIPQGHGEEVNPMTVTQSLDRSREQAYSLLATLMVRRALSEAAQQLSEASIDVAAAVAGTMDVGAYAERSINKVMKELEWVGLSTGLRLRADGSPVLPHRFSLTRLYAELTSRVHLLVNEATNAEDSFQLALKVQRLRRTIESLERQFNLLCEKAGPLPNMKQQSLFDTIALKRWLAVYELLLEGIPPQPSAAEKEEAQQLNEQQEAFFAQVRAEEATQLQRLLRRRVLLEAAELEALIAGFPSDEVKEDTLVFLEPWIQQLDEVVRVARLAGGVPTTALDLILHYGEKASYTPGPYAYGALCLRPQTSTTHGCSFKKQRPPRCVAADGGSPYKGKPDRITERRHVRALWLLRLEARGGVRCRIAQTGPPTAKVNSSNGSSNTSSSGTNSSNSRSSSSSLASNSSSSGRGIRAAKAAAGRRLTATCP